MKIIGLKDFNVKWLRGRHFLCFLPTELVLEKPNQEFRLNEAFYYYTDFPPVLKEGNYNGSRYSQNVRTVAIEVHENYGDDGHTDYVFRDKFILLEETEVPKDFEEYRKLINEAYSLEIRSNEHQLNFNDVKWVYDCSWY